MKANPHRLKKRTVLPKFCGIYFLWKKNKLLYIGGSAELYTRIKNQAGFINFDRFSFILCDKKQLPQWEAFYIAKYMPPLNINVPGQKRQYKLHRDLRRYPHNGRIKI